MTPRPVIYLPLEKKDGKVEIDRLRFAKLLEQLKDGKYDLTIERWVRSRSGKQNRAYWACIVGPISEHTGYEADEVHELLKFYCNPKTIEVLNPRTGVVEEVTVGGSTAAMNIEDFNLYFARCQQFAAEKLDCECPDPNEEHAFNK
jgi:hypothetical protein